MKLETFFDNFEVLAEAPNGVQKLRELILQLAVRGKLVPQDEKDESAEVLLEKIKMEKERLTKEKEIKKTESLSPAKTEEMIYDLPKTWKWSMFSEICSYIQRGKSPDYVEKSNFPVISQKCVQWEGLKIENVRFISPSSIEKYDKERFLRTGDILWNSTGTGTVGRASVYIHKSDFYEKVVVDSHVTIVRPIKVNPKFLYLWIASPSVQNEIENLTSGSTKQVELATSTIRNQMVPIPPLEEQHRVVAKVDQLMSLCYELEARQQKKRESRVRLNNAVLDRLLAARAQGEFEQGWRRVCDNFELLYDTPENVGALRQAILQLAVMGKLVEQDANDEPTSVLLERIKAEKERLVKEGKIRQGKPLTSIKEEEIPYKLPKEWQWVRLEDLVSLLGDGLHGTPKYSDRGDYFFINGNNLSDGKILIKNNTKRVSIDEYNRYKKKLDERTVLVSINGTLGNVAFYNNEKIILGKSACYFNLLHNINKFYLKLLINTSYFLEYAFKNATGSTIQNVSLKSMRLFLVPLPPLEEQKRIVAKVNQLMSLCDELEAGLARSQADGERLMEAVVGRMLAGGDSV